MFRSYICGSMGVFRSHTFTELWVCFDHIHVQRCGHVWSHTCAEEQMCLITHMRRSECVWSHICGGMGVFRSHTCRGVCVFRSHVWRSKCLWSHTYAEEWVCLITHMCGGVGMFRSHTCAEVLVCLITHMCEWVWLITHICGGVGVFDQILCWRMLLYFIVKKTGFWNSVAVYWFRLFSFFLGILSVPYCLFYWKESVTSRRPKLNSCGSWY